jgi:poly(A) polymerase
MKRGEGKLRLQRRGWLKDPALQKVLGVLNKRGAMTRVAGGAVRNALLGRQVEEVDLATMLRPEEVIRAAEEAGLKVHPTGLDHGTVTVVADGKPFEVTTLRVDVETFGRRARVSFTDDWKADASRRDFTMNALYCDAKGEVHDPLGGYKDLKRGRVRFVGEPKQRIREDFLRILRFFRFNAQYGKGSPDPQGLRQCIALRKHLKSLSGERVRQELWKLLPAQGAARMLKVMNDAGIARLLLGRDGDVNSLKRMAAVDERLKLPPDPLLRLELVSGDGRRYREAFKLTNAEMARLNALKHGPAPLPGLREAERRVVLYQLGKQAFLDSVRLGWARSKVPASDKGWRSLLMFGRRAELPRFPVSGEDLKARGMQPGPQLGATLKALEDWWMATGFPADKALVLKRLDAMAPLPSTAGSAHNDPAAAVEKAEEP